MTPEEITAEYAALADLVLGLPVDVRNELATRIQCFSQIRCMRPDHSPIERGNYDIDPLNEVLIPDNPILIIRHAIGMYPGIRCHDSVALIIDPKTETTLYPDADADPDDHHQFTSPRLFDGPDPLGFRAAIAFLRWRMEKHRS